MNDVFTYNAVQFKVACCDPAELGGTNTQPGTGARIGRNTRVFCEGVECRPRRRRSSAWGFMPLIPPPSPWETTEQTAEDGDAGRCAHVCAMSANQHFSSGETLWQDCLAGRNQCGPPLSSGDDGAQSAPPPWKRPTRKNSPTRCSCCSEKNVVWFNSHTPLAPVGDDALCTICYEDPGVSEWKNENCGHSACFRCGLEYYNSEKSSGKTPMCHMCKSCPWEPISTLRNLVENYEDDEAVEERRQWQKPSVATGSEITGNENYVAVPVGYRDSDGGAGVTPGDVCLLVELAESGVPKEDFSCSYSGVPFGPMDQVIRTTCCCRMFNKKTFLTEFWEPTAWQKLPTNQRTCLNPVCPSNERPSDFFEWTWVDFPELLSCKVPRVEQAQHRDCVASWLRRNDVILPGVIFVVSDVVCCSCSTIFGPGEELRTECCSMLICAGCVKKLRRCPSPLCARCVTVTDPNHAGLPEPGSVNVYKCTQEWTYTLADVQRILNRQCSKIGKIINPRPLSSAQWWLIVPAQDRVALEDNKVKIKVGYYSDDENARLDPNPINVACLDLAMKYGYLDAGGNRDDLYHGSGRSPDRGLWVVAKGGSRLLLSDFRRTLIDRINSLPDVNKERRSVLPGEDALPTIGEVHIQAATFWREVSENDNRLMQLRDEEELSLEGNWRIYMAPPTEKRLREVEEDLIVRSTGRGRMEMVSALWGTAPSPPPPGNSLAISLAISPYHRPSFTHPISVPSDAPGDVGGGSLHPLPGADSQPTDGVPASASGTEVLPNGESSHPTGDTTPGLDGDSSDPNKDPDPRSSPNKGPKNPRRSPPRVVIEEDPSSREEKHQIDCTVLILLGFIVALVLVYTVHRGCEIFGS